MIFPGRAMMKVATGVFVAISFLPPSVFGEQKGQQTRSLRSTAPRRLQQPLPQPGRSYRNHMSELPAA